MTLATYISDNFPTIKTQLGWNDSTQIVTIVDKALELYGVATEVLATDLTKLHALADVAVWRQALNDISLDIAFSADGASYQRNQAVDAVRKNLDNAESLAIAYLPAYQATVHVGDNNPDWTE
jgi:hypothetical protein